MFDFREFVKKGLIDAVGNIADYKVRLNAASWFDKDVLTEEDLAEINTALEMYKPNPSAIEQTDVLEG